VTRGPSAEQQQQQGKGYGQRRKLLSYRHTQTGASMQKQRGSGNGNGGASREDDDEETGLGCTHQHQHPASTAFGISSRPIEGPRTKGGREGASYRMDGWTDGWIGRRSDLQRKARLGIGEGKGKASSGKVRFRIGLTDERTTYRTD
jgi:hypothetical protein